MGIRIITDSSADFDRATAKRRQVEIVSMAVQFGNASFLDGKTIDPVIYTECIWITADNVADYMG